MRSFEFCLPTKGIAVPVGPDWLHEVKYDGYRLRLERDGDRVRLITRGGYLWVIRVDPAAWATSSGVALAADRRDAIAIVTFGPVETLHHCFFSCSAISGPIERNSSSCAAMAFNGGEPSTAFYWPASIKSSTNWRSNSRRASSEIDSSLGVNSLPHRETRDTSAFTN